MSEEILDSDRPLHEVLVDFEMYLNRYLKPSSIRVYMAAIKTYFLEGNKIDSPQDYLEYILAHMKDRRSSHYYNIILKFVSYIKIRKDIKKLILTTINSLKKIEHDPIKKTLILSKRQRMEIINSIPSYKHQIVALIQEECGVRAGDVLRLERGFINYSVDEGVTVMIISFKQKGDKRRSIYIYNPETIDRIQQFIRTKYLHKDYYFLEDFETNDKFEQYALEKRNYDFYYDDLREACQKLGHNPSEFTSHDIRRNFAVDTLPIVENNVAELQKAMGHADVDTTIRYLRYSGLETKDVFKKRYENNKTN